MAHIVHGKWERYHPTKRPAGVPEITGMLFARREGDDVDWYVYAKQPSETFKPNTVKVTVMWHPWANAHLINVATRDVTMIFPAGQYVIEIDDYVGNDPQTDLGGKVYNLDTGEISVRDIGTPPPRPEELIKQLEARIAALEAK